MDAKTRDILARRGIGARVAADPRVTWTREALDAFLASPAGQALDAAATGPDWRVKMEALDEKIKNRYEELAREYQTARLAVVRELLGELGAARGTEAREG